MEKPETPGADETTADVAATPVRAGARRPRVILADSSLLRGVASAAESCTRAHLSLVSALTDYVFLVARRGETATIAESVERHRAGDGRAAAGPWGLQAGTTSSPGGKASAPSTSTVSASAPGSVFGLPPVEEPLPDFPGFDPDTSLAAWTREHLSKDDIIQISAICGSPTGRTLRTVAMAVTLSQGLPRFHSRIADGEFTAAHSEVVTSLCLSVPMRHLPQLDAYLARRRADVTCETLRRTLVQRISVLEPPEERYREAAERRRVEVDNHGDGSSALIISGPTLDINACYQRVMGMARAVHSNQVSAFGLPKGTMIDDGRGVDALAFDILTRTVPTLTTRITSIDPVSGTPLVHDEPFRPEATGPAPVGDPAPIGGVTPSLVVDSRCSASSARTRDQRDHSFGGPVGEPEVISREMLLVLPTAQWWLSSQAALIATVPFLTAFGQSLLPGQLPDGSPIPAETARRLAGSCPTLYRVLTDPATGTPLDARATAYRIPRDVRTTVTSQWALCTAPGCTREAVRSELDHVIPFDHDHPDQGGLTRFGNLHPLCPVHHGLKTGRVFDVRMPKSGLVEYSFRQGVRTSVHAPDAPIDTAHALEWWTMDRFPAQVDWTRPPPYSDAEPMDGQGSAAPQGTQTEGSERRVPGGSGDTSAFGAIGAGSAPEMSTAKGRDISAEGEKYAGARSVSGPTGEYCALGPDSLTDWGRMAASGIRTIAANAAAAYVERQRRSSAEKSRSSMSAGQAGCDPDAGDGRNGQVPNAPPQPAPATRAAAEPRPRVEAPLPGGARTESADDIFSTMIEGAEIVEYDPVILECKKAISRDYSVKIPVMMRNRREQILADWERLKRAGPESNAARIIDWEHRFDGDPPPF
ncbi:hypothetical protein DFO66_11925 [Brevibacterium sanguinis]|uniref:HNH endonuclease n=2 Tax=Brevibacterium TaxID=1696 RepID=A0A366IML2_9MICO|nr:hypothetical protein DFO66_11925 [Brevibacterium sanguinis]RBP74318.1 hypothetical protein DFO65_10135 [Brevibacterium celere]